MTKQSEHRLTNFWIGFSCGIAGAVGMAYLFGTKSGRDTVKKMLLFSENLEENLVRLIERVDKQKPKKEGKNNPFHLDDIENILTKIKQVTNHA